MMLRNLFFRFAEIKTYESFQNLWYVRVVC